MKQLVIDGINTQYMIDEQGNIYNTKTKKILTGSIKTGGYKSVKLTINGKKKDYMVHRLVAMTFLPNPDNLPFVNHKNRDKTQNDITNLEWVTASENMIHCNATGKATRQKIISINEDIITNPNWKQYKNSNYYFCNDGRACNIKTGKYLNPSSSGENNYDRYYLYLNGKRKVFLAHKLIYEVFNPDDTILNTDDINHIDGNKHNNAITNLEKISRSDNMKHSYYVLHQNVKRVAKYDLNHNLIATYASMNEAARQNNCSSSGISQAANHNIKTYYGYIWEII